MSKGLGVCLLLYTYNSVMTAQYKWQAKPDHLLMQLGAAFDCQNAPLYACLGMASNGCAMVWASVGASAACTLERTSSPIPIAHP